MSRMLRFDRHRRSVRFPWPAHLTLEERISRLRLLWPSDVEAIEVLVNEALMRRWPHPPSKRKSH